jgi:hypothetical protein
MVFLSYAESFGCPRGKLPVSQFRKRKYAYVPVLKERQIDDNEADAVHVARWGAVEYA